MHDWLTFGVSTFALLVSFASLWYTVHQVKLLKAQLQVDAASKIAAVNRELLTLAFNQPELFLLFDDKPLQDQIKQRHYIQLWFNHIDLMWDSHRKGLISADAWGGMQRDIQDFFSIRTVRRQWEQVQSYHTPAFVTFVTEMRRASKSKPGDPEGE